MGWFVCSVWVFFFFFFRKAIKWVGLEEGKDGRAGGIFSFSLTKDWFLFKLAQKREGRGGEKWVSLLWTQALGRLFVTVGMGLSVYMTFYITRLIECL